MGIYNVPLILIGINPHPQLQKNLLVCSLQGPHGPQKVSGVVKKICKPRDHCSMPIIAEYASDKVFWGPHGPRIRGLGLMEINKINNNPPTFY